MDLKKTASSIFLVLSSGPLQFVGATIAVLLAQLIPDNNLSFGVLTLVFIIATTLMSSGLISSSITFGIASYFWGWTLFPLLFISYMISSLLGYGIGVKLGSHLLEYLSKRGHPI